MKLIPITLNDLPHLQPVSWRFKKHHVHGKIHYRKNKDDFIYVLEHPQFKVKNSELDDNKTFETLEDARIAAENWIDLWYAVQGRILAL